jgi:hypothetical protein
MSNFAFFISSKEGGKLPAVKEKNPYNRPFQD